MTNDLTARERLRRLAVASAAIFLVIWLIIVQFYSLDYRWEIPNTPLGNLLRALNLLVVPLAMAAALFSTLVTAIYNPTGVCNRLFGRFLPHDPKKRALLEKWSWLPSDALIVIAPLLALAQIAHQDFPEGELTPMDMRIAWITNTALLPIWIFAVARWRNLWSLTFIGVVHLTNFAAYLIDNPRLLGDAWVVGGNSALLALLMYLLVATIRSAASSLDKLTTQVTRSRIEITSNVAVEMTRSSANRLIKGPILTALNAAADATDDDSWLHAQEQARRAIGEMNSSLTSIPTAEADAVTAEEFLTRIKDDVARVAPQVSVQVSSVRILPVPRPVLNHLSAALCELVTTAMEDNEAAQFVTVQVTVADRDITCQLTIAPGFTNTEHLLDNLPALGKTLLALPGASVSTVSHVTTPRTRPALRLGRAQAETLAGVRLLWEPEAELRTDPADASGEVHGHLRLTNLVTGPLGTATATMIVIFVFTFFISSAFLAADHVVSQWVNLVSLLLYLGILSGILIRTVFLDRKAPFPISLVIITIVSSLAVIAVSLANLKDMTDFALEVEWWPIIALIMALVWLTGSTNGPAGIITAVVIGVFLAVWGFWADHGTTMLVGASVPLIIIVTLATAVVSWVWREIANAAKTRREDRVMKLALAHHRAANQERRAVARYLDDVARPFLLHLAAGMPRTVANHVRAQQLASLVYDNQTAPIFQGTQVTQAAADARARGVTVELQDEGALDNANPYMLNRTVRVTVNALDAMVDGSVLVKVNAPGTDQAAIIRSIPATEEPRLIEVLPDGSVVYDGIRVRPTKQVTL